LCELVPWVELAAAYLDSDISPNYTADAVNPDDYFALLTLYPNYAFTSANVADHAWRDWRSDEPGWTIRVTLSFEVRNYA